MPILIALPAFIVFTMLLVFGKVGEASYCFLVAATVLLGLVLHGFGRLRELDLRSLRLVLRDIEVTKQELFVREEQLKRIAVPLAQVMALSGASEGRFGDEKSWSAKRSWYRAKIQALVDAIGLSPSEATETFKYSDMYDQIDRLLEGRGGLMTSDTDYEVVSAKLTALAEELRSMMEADVQVAK